MPNVEYYAPWFRSEGIMRCMPHERWQGLSSHGQRTSRYVVCDKGEAVVGAGYMHPKSKMREKFKDEQFAEMGEQAAQEYRNRL